MYQELEEMKKRLKEMEEEAAALRDMQAKVEKEMSAQGEILTVIQDHVHVLLFAHECALTTFSG